MISNLLQILGLILITICGFLIAPWVGFLLAGLAVFAVGLMLELTRTRNDSLPK